MKPVNWPEGFIYTPSSFSSELHPALLKHFLSTGNAEDFDCVHLLLEKQTVHSALMIKELPLSHPLGALKDALGNRQRGLFALAELPSGVDLGEYAGEMRLIDASWKLNQKEHNYSLVIPLGAYRFIIDAKKWANELAFINDYRGIAKAPNVIGTTAVHRGCYYPIFQTLSSISPGEELLIDYGPGYWH